MASYDLDPKSGRYHIRFRHDGRPFKRSVKLPDERAARTLCGRVEDTLRELRSAASPSPLARSPARSSFRRGRSPESPRPAVTSPWRNSSRLSRGRRRREQGEDDPLHRGHPLRSPDAHPGADDARPDRRPRRGQSLRAGRRKEKWRGRHVNAATARKELKTFRIVWAWGQKHGHLPAPVPFALGEVDFPKGVEKERFRTRQEIEAILARGGVKPGHAQRLWEGLYLAQDEVLEVLEHVRENARHPFVYPMFCMAACTGARRSEIVRSRVEDWDLERSHRRTPPEEAGPDQGLHLPLRGRE